MLLSIRHAYLEVHASLKLMPKLPCSRMRVVQCLQLKAMANGQRMSCFDNFRSATRIHVNV